MYGIGMASVQVKTLDSCNGTLLNGDAPKYPKEN